MPKPIIVIAIILALGILASVVNGSKTNADRAELIRQCQNDPSCTYVQIHE